MLSSTSSVTVVPYCTASNRGNRPRYRQCSNISGPLRQAGTETGSPQAVAAAASDCQLPESMQFQCPHFSSDQGLIPTPASSRAMRERRQTENFSRSHVSTTSHRPLLSLAYLPRQALVDVVALGQLSVSASASLPAHVVVVVVVSLTLCHLISSCLALSRPQISATGWASPMSLPPFQLASGRLQFPRASSS